MLSSSEINFWLRTVKPYRSNLDLATIIWFWTSLENTNNWEPIRNEINTVCGDVIDETKKGFYLPTAINKGERSFAGYDISTERTSIEQWMLDYREVISKVTPFSDYEIYDDAEISIYGDELEPSKYYMHPVLSNQELTHCFVDLDLLLDRLSDMGCHYPPQLVMTCHESSSESELEKVHSYGEISKNPFFIYSLIPKVEEFLWSGTNSAGEILKTVAPKVASSEFKLLLAAIFGVNQSQANALRIYTQPKRMSSKRVKGENLKNILRPLMKVLLLEGGKSIAFWRLKKRGLADLAKCLNIESSEMNVLMLIARPSGDIDGSYAATFDNPGNTQPKAFMPQLENMVDEYLPMLRNKLIDPKQREYHKKLQDFMDKTQ